MKRILPTAVAAALLAGTAPFAIAPAVAQKKGEEAKAPALKLSKEVRDPAAKAQAALAAKDLATAEPLVAQAEAAAKTEDDKYIAAALRLNVEVLKSQAPGGSVAEVGQELLGRVALAVQHRVGRTPSGTRGVEFRGRNRADDGRVATPGPHDLAGELEPGDCTLVGDVPDAGGLLLGESDEGAGEIPSDRGVAALVVHEAHGGALVGEPQDGAGDVAAHPTADPGGPGDRMAGPVEGLLACQLRAAVDPEGIRRIGFHVGADLGAVEHVVGRDRHDPGSGSDPFGGLGDDPHAVGVDPLGPVGVALAAVHVGRSEEHTSELSHVSESRMPSSA